MKLLSWNIQWARGVDGKVDPSRIVDTALALADFDVLCLQEVAAGFTGPELAGIHGENQFEAFARLLSDYTAVPVAAVDVVGRDGERRVFGNLLLSRLPVLQVLRHQLPWPVDAKAKSMPRALLEATIASPFGPVRVMTTHLEYYSALQREAQVEALRELHGRACERARKGPCDEAKPGPFFAMPQTQSTILCGDFNFPPEDALHAGLQADTDNAAPRLVDVWDHLHPGAARPPSVGVHDHKQWPTPFTCDYVLVSEDLLPRVRRLHVDQDCNYSDHQPLLLELD